MSVIKAFRRTLSDIRKRGLEPAVIRVSIEQDMMIDNEGIMITSIVESAGNKADSESILNLLPPKTLGGIQRVTDLRVPPDVLIFEDKNGHELARVTGLAVPTPF